MSAVPEGILGLNSQPKAPVGAGGVRVDWSAAGSLLSSSDLSLLYVQSLPGHSFSGFKLEEDF